MPMRAGVSDGDMPRTVHTCKSPGEVAPRSTLCSNLAIFPGFRHAILAFQITRNTLARIRDARTRLWHWITSPPPPALPALLPGPAGMVSPPWRIWSARAAAGIFPAVDVEVGTIAGFDNSEDRRRLYPGRAGKFILPMTAVCVLSVAGGWGQDSGCRGWRLCSLVICSWYQCALPLALECFGVPLLLP